MQEHKTAPNPPVTSELGTLWVVGQIILIAAIILVPAQINGVPALPDSLNPIAIGIGVIMALFGLTMIALGSFSLGPNLTVFPRPKANGSLQQSGIYGIVRHPIYSGVLLAALGASIARISLPSLVLTVILAVYFDRKAHREEGWLQEKFPEYAAYRKRVHKLIPWVY